MLSISSTAAWAWPARKKPFCRSLAAIAQIDVAQVPSGDAKAAIQYAVLGTALYEPILAALRRLAHQDVSSSELGGRPEGA
jgi:hypothetical protein